MPSFVEFQGNGVVEVGEQARRNLFINNNAVGRFKRDMGTATTYDLHGKSYTPTELSAFLPRRLD